MAPEDSSYPIDIPARLGMLPGSLDPVRKERHQRLEGQSKSLAGLYSRALELLPTCDQPADLSLLSHCVREILNRLP
jgi:hypothetical protein